MSREPEERDGFLKDKSPQHLPIQTAHDPSHIQWCEETTECTAVHQNMGIRNFMQRHKYRSENGIHTHRHGKSHPYFSPAQSRCMKNRRSLLHAKVLQKCRSTIRKNNHRHINAHPQYPPYKHPGQNPESFPAIHAGTNPQADHLSQSRQDGKFQETHDHAMSRIKSMIPFVNRPADKKG